MRKRLAKLALKHPDLFSAAELNYFGMWIEEHDNHKGTKKKHEDFLENRPKLSTNVQEEL